MGKTGKKQRQRARAELAEKIAFSSVAPGVANINNSDDDEPPPLINNDPQAEDPHPTASRSSNERFVNSPQTPILPPPSAAVDLPLMIEAVVKGDAPPDILPFYWQWVIPDDPVSNPHPWRFEQREGKGYVPVANRAYKAGEHLCGEDLLICTRGGHADPMFSSKQIKDMKKNVAKLSESDKVAFFSLPNVYQVNEHPKELGIFITSSTSDYNILDVEGTCQSLIFYAFSYIKHSCIPNVNYDVIDSKRIEFHAIRDIAEGEEITITRGDLGQIRSERRRRFQEKYRFNCQCAGCEYDPTFAYPSWKQGKKEMRVTDKATFEQYVKFTDDCRKMYDECSAKVAIMFDRGDLREGYAYGTNLMKLMELPVNQLWTPMYISHLYSDYAKQRLEDRDIKKMFNQWDEAIKLRKEIEVLFTKAYQVTLLISGPHHPETKRCQKVLDLLAKEAIEDEEKKRIYGDRSARGTLPIGENGEECVIC